MCDWRPQLFSKISLGPVVANAGMQTILLKIVRAHGPRNVKHRETVFSYFGPNHLRFWPTLWLYHPVTQILNWSCEKSSSWLLDNDSKSCGHFVCFIAEQSSVSYMDHRLFLILAANPLSVKLTANSNWLAISWMTQESSKFDASHFPIMATHGFSLQVPVFKATSAFTESSRGASRSVADEKDLTWWFTLTCTWLRWKEIPLSALAGILEETPTGRSTWFSWQ